LYGVLIEQAVGKNHLKDVDVEGGKIGNGSSEV
jgi:hypothetical protein